jgi:hypothetical protein
MDRPRVRVDPVTGEVVENPEIRDFASVLLDLDKGRLHAELSEALWDVLQAVQAVKKAGAVTLTLRVGPTSDADDAPLVFTGQVKTSLPKAKAQPTMMYVDRQGNPSRSNPNQPELDGLRMVESGNSGKARRI